MSLSVIFDKNLITVKEKEKIQTQTDTSFFGDERRIISCCNHLEIKEKTKIIVDLGSHILINSAEYAAKGALVGSIIGGPVIGFFGLMFAGIPGFVTGWKTGVAINTAGCAIEGALNGIRQFKIEFMSSQKYKNWIEECRKSDVYPIYEKIIKSDVRFQDYLCPLTCDFISVPVRAPDGRVYENDSIVQWIRQKEKQINEAIENQASQKKIQELRQSLSPIRANVPSFTIEDLRYHPDYFSKLDHLAKAKIAEMEDNETKRIFKEAMKAIQESHTDDRKQIIKLQIAEVTMYVINNDLDTSISHNICRKLMEELNKIDHE